MHSVPSALLLLLPLLTPTAQPVTDQNRRKLPTPPHHIWTAWYVRTASLSVRTSVDYRLSHAVYSAARRNTFSGSAWFICRT